MGPADVVDAKREGALGVTAREPAGVAVAARESPERRSSGSQRLANVERLRLLAMLEIVAFHVSEQQRLPIIAGLGLPSFLLLNNAFNCTLSERMGTRAFLRTKVSRLLVPWLVWSVVFASVLLAEKLRHDEPLSEAFSPWMIIGGTYDHLWFVPFALAGGLFIAALHARTREVSHRTMLLVGMLAGTAVVGLAGLVVSRARPEWPALQWLFALPSPILGFALGRAILAADQRLMARVAIASVSAAVAAWVAVLSFNAPEMVTRYATSLALVSLAFVLPGRLDRLSRWLTPLLFGIYLTHPLVMRVYRALHLPALGAAPLAVLIFALSALLVALMRRSPLRHLV